MPETFSSPVSFKYCRTCQKSTPHELRQCDNSRVLICSICWLLASQAKAQVEHHAYTRPKDYDPDPEVKKWNEPAD